MTYPLFRVACDSYYLYTKYYYDPVSVLAASKINLLPYQLEDFLNLLDLVESGRPVRSLIAYETGLGKTIVAGLFLKEMALKNEDNRILILTPPNVQYQWQDELKDKFGFDIPLLKDVLDGGGDPLKQKWLIASMDTLKGEKWFSRMRNEDYKREIVIVDELHRATPENRRAQLIKFLSDGRTDHMLALTATPHDGKEEHFIYRLGLINSNVDDDNWEDFVENYAFRRRKKEVIDLEGERVFPQQVLTETFEIEPDEEEKDFYWEVENYIRSYYKMAEEQNNKAIGLVATTVGRTVSSSIDAGVTALERRLNRLIYGITEDIDTGDLMDEMNRAEEEADDEKLEELRNKLIEYIPSAKRDFVEKEKQKLQELISIGHNLQQREEKDHKTKKLISILEDVIKRGDKAIIYTQFLATLSHLQEALEEIYDPKDIAIVHGGLSHEQKKSEVSRLWNEAKVMIATDAAGESLNLQAANVVIHYEIPWNPVVYIQRVGRVYRYGQEKNVFIYGMLPVFKVEKRVLEVVVDKIKAIERDFDIGSVEVIGNIISEKDVEDTIRREYAKEEESAEEIENKFEKGKGLLDRIKLALQKAEAAKKHVRAEKLFEDKGILEIVTEEDLRKYLYYLRESGFGMGNFSDEFTYFEVKDEEIDPQKILVEQKPTKPELLDLRDKNTLNEKELKLDNPVIQRSLYLGMCNRGKGLFVGEEDGKGEVRILKLFDYDGEPIYETLVVIFNGKYRPYSYVRSLEPLILPENVNKKIFDKLDYQVAEISDREFVDQIKQEQKLYLREKVGRVLKKLRMDEEYYKRFSDEWAKMKIQQIQEEKKDVYRKPYKIYEDYSEAIASFWVIKPENLSDLAYEVGEQIDDSDMGNLLGKVEEFDPQLWKKKKEVELAGMDIVEECEKKKGRKPIDVSADGQGYDIESKDLNSGKKRRIEVKSFKKEPYKVTLSENEYKAANFYKNSFWLYVVERALDENADCSHIEKISDPANKLNFDIEWRPYYVWRVNE